MGIWVDILSLIWEKICLTTEFNTLVNKPKKVERKLIKCSMSIEWNYPAMRRNEALMSPMVGMRLEDFMLSERSQAQKATHHMTPNTYTQDGQTCKGRRKQASSCFILQSLG